ncbi:diguanylate cyclase [Pseudoxanthobacter sp.]|uniref:GGDEF domain-containing protein n=1 Tax=Pseudoxanthobacter sp. TaxID=1925742 RepID=UPI002FE3F183
MAYVFGLLAIGILTAGVHFLLDRVILEQRDSATIINVAGRQRMLSQRIALMASNLRAGDETARGVLEDSIALMERSHAALVGGNDLGIVHPLPQTLRPYYFEGPHALDPAVRRYIAAARQFAADGSPEAYQTVETAARGAILTTLDGAVSLFEHEANRHIDGLRRIQKVLLCALLIALVLEAILIFRPLVRKIREYAARLIEIAAHDSLTGLFNRRYFMDTAQRALALCERVPGRAVSVLMMDLDFFKRINDTYGHAAGDRVLRTFAATVGEKLRGGDLLARLGGEEFAVLLPGTDRMQAFAVAEKLRQAVAVAAADGLPVVTVSIGIGTYLGRHDTLDDLLSRADRALYQAKLQGRNQACAQPSIPPLPPAAPATA